MPIIKIKTHINAPIEIVFDLSRSIDLHKISTSHTNEEAIAGITSGLIGLNESVTWKAKHLGVVQTLTSKITEYDRPRYFADEMENGVFKKFKHEHHFESSGNQTLMIDYFDYQSPMGLLGKLADSLFLKKYLTNLLSKRNETIKKYAETDMWKKVLIKTRHNNA